MINKKKQNLNFFQKMARFFQLTLVSKVAFYT